MCNLFQQNLAYSHLVEELTRLRTPLVCPTPAEAPNLEPREVKPTDPAAVIRPRGEGVELVQLKWGFSPGAPKRPPVTNFRAEGRRFGPGRCLIPASAFFEFTGSRYPKTRWRFTEVGEDWFCMAGLWRAAEGAWPESFTLLTCAPGEDMRPYHDRQVIVLPRAQWTAWLDPASDPASVLRPGPPGSLAAEQSPREGPAAQASLF